jgi:hypothetical protein
MPERFPSKGYFVGRYWLSRRDRSRMWCRTWYELYRPRLLGHWTEAYAARAAG